MSRDARPILRATTSPNNVITTGGELTFVKFDSKGDLETMGFHSSAKEKLSRLLANELAKQTGGNVLARHGRDAEPNRSVPYVEIQIVEERASGMPPPSLQRFFVRPDSDVIEVNLPPSGSIEHSEALVRMVYECAKRVGLLPSRSIGRRSIGTRGGLHITFSCAGSRSDARLSTLSLAIGLLEVSMHCPFLSYLFCGDRAGIDGFHPRLDEVAVDAQERFNALKAIASGYKAGLAEGADLWPQVATAMTQLMRDRFGRSHVVEISLDKLWSSDPNRDLQIVELRQFEMTKSVEEALALLRFMWAIAHRIAHRQINLNNSSQERCNPDFMEYDLSRFWEDNYLNELNVDIQKLLEISRSRYPTLSESDDTAFHYRLRMGRVETFCETYRIKNDVHVDIFVPYRMTFSLALSPSSDHSRRHVLSFRVCLLESYLAVRQAVIDSREFEYDVVDCLSSTIVLYIQSTIFALKEGVTSSTLDMPHELFRETLRESTVEFSLPRGTFSGTLHIDRE